MYNLFFLTENSFCKKTFFTELNLYLRLKYTVTDGIKISAVLIFNIPFKLIGVSLQPNVFFCV